MYSNIASLIEHSLLKRGTTLNEIELLCREAIDNNFAAVCVPPLFVKKAKELITGSSVKLVSVIGFPYGYSAIEPKLAEIILAMVDGADEMDMVVNMTALKNNDWQYLARELNTILPIVQNKGKVLKVVIEGILLSDDELVKCCDLYGAAGVPYISLSTGIEEGLPSIETVRLVRKHLADSVQIKIAGDFSSYEAMALFVKAGVNRIGSRMTVK